MKSQIFSGEISCRTIAILALALSPLMAQTPRVITTIAGTEWLFPGDGKPALKAPLSGNFGLDLATDSNGNFYISDDGNMMAMRVGSDGIINVIAGNGFNFESGDGELAVNGALFQPSAIAVDSFQNIYIGEYRGRIRKVTPDGIIRTIAGSDSGFSGDGGPASKAQFAEIYGLAVDNAGNIYVADTENQRIRKIATDGIVTTIAGSGQIGFSGDGGPALNAQFAYPTRIAVDGQGNVYVTDSQNARIRKIDARGVITSLVGGGTSIDEGIDAASAAAIPLAVAVDSSGNLFYADIYFQGVRKINAQGKVTTVAGGTGNAGFSGDGGVATKALFHFGLYPALSIDRNGTLFIADELNERIRRLGSDGVIQTMAGNGLFHFSGDGGPATSATLDKPTGLSVDTDGGVYFTEILANRIRRIARDGTISVVAGNGDFGYYGDGGPATSAALAFPTGVVALANGGILFTDSLNCVLRSVSPSGIISTLAGSGNCGFAGDGGNFRTASFDAPTAIAIYADGSTYISDTNNQRVRVIFPDGQILTLAGVGIAGFSGDGSISTRAKLNNPVGLAFNKGDLYIADTGNHRIRKIDSNLIITTVAGNGTAGFSGDGGAATAASLQNPRSLTFDAAGNMYIADQSNERIRLVTPDGTISTIAGSPNAELGDGGPATKAFIGAPSDVAFDAAGNLLIADIFTDRVRSILVNPPSFQAAPAALAFTAAAGSTVQDQELELTGSITGVPFTTTTTSTGNWLQVSVSSGIMPASLRVIATPGTLAAGTYNGTVNINSALSSPATIIITVALTITAADQPTLSISPNSFSFAYLQDAEARTRAISVSNIGGGTLTFTTTATTQSGGKWLSTSTPGGSLNAFQAAAMNVIADPKGLDPGTYSGTVTFSSLNPPQSVITAVTMTISTVHQTIQIPQSGLTFFAVENGGQPPPQFFSILNGGDGQMQWSISYSTLSGGQWLGTFPTSGQTDADSELVPQIRVGVSPEGLAAGIYYATIKVTAPGAANNPEFVSVVLNVLPAGSSIGPIVQPSGLIFSSAAGGDQTGSQVVVVQNAGSTPITFRSGRITLDGKSWFTSLPGEGQITQAQPQRIIVQPKVGGLAAGVYRGTLTLSFSDNSTRVIAIVLVVTPSAITGSKDETRAISSGCLASTLAPVFTQLSEGSSIPAGFPGQVSVKVIDNCAKPMTTGGVTVTFTNGDPPIRLTSLKDGTWAGTWTPQRKASQITVTAAASIPEQGLKGQVQLKVGTQDFNQPPLISDGGIRNGASMTNGAPVAPGSVIAIAGSNLAGGSVLVAGRDATVIDSTDTQLRAVMPAGIPVNTSHQLLVTRGASISVPQSLTVAAAAPGVFTVDGSGSGQGMVLVGTDVADAAHAAKAGDSLIIYCTGLGEVDAQSNLVSPVKVLMGDQPATVQSAGLIPGKPGVYQITAVVPAGITASGQVPLVISEAGQLSPPVTFAVQ